MLCILVLNYVQILNVRILNDLELRMFDWLLFNVKQSIRLQMMPVKIFMNIRRKQLLSFTSQVY